MHPLRPHAHFAAWADRAVLVALGLFAAALLAIVLTFAYGRDQGVFAVVGATLRDGGIPYRDAWDVKPPGIFFVYALARLLFGDAMHAIRIVEVLAFASLFPAFMVLSRRALGQARVGIWAATLAVFLHARLEFWETAQPESFGAVLVAWALVCATTAMDAVRPWRHRLAWVLCGALYACAALLKPPLGSGFLVSLAAIWWTCRGERRRERVALVVAMVCGATTVLGGTAALFALRGAWSDLYDTLFVFAPAYTALDFELARLPQLVWRAARALFFDYSPIVLLGWLLLWLPRPIGATARGVVLHVAGVIVLQLVGVALQAKFYHYHFGATLPLAALVAGWGLWRAWERLRARWVLALVFVALVVAVGGVTRLQPAHYASFWENFGTRWALLLGRAEADTRARLHSAYGVNFAANERAAAWLQANAPAEAPVFIWGFETMIYDMAGRRPASRYVYNVPLRLDWRGRDAARRTLLEELARTPPAVVVVVQKDRLPFLTGSRFDSARDLANFPQLQEFLNARYTAAARVEDLILLTPRRGGR